MIIFETPLFALGFGILFVLVFGWLWLQTSHKGFLLGVVATLILTGALLILEKSIVTPREEVVDAIQQIARDAERNDIELLVRHAHPAGNAEQHARGEIPSYRFYSVQPGNSIDVTVDEGAAPQEATAAFYVSINAESVRGGSFAIPKKTYRLFVTLELRKDGDVWKVLDYTYDHPLQGMRRRQ